MSISFPNNQQRSFLNAHSIFYSEPTHDKVPASERKKSWWPGSAIRLTGTGITLKSLKCERNAGRRVHNSSDPVIDVSWQSVRRKLQSRNSENPVRNEHLSARSLDWLHAFGGELFSWKAHLPLKSAQLPAENYPCSKSLRQFEFPYFITLFFSKTLRGTDNYAEWVNAKFEDLLYGDNDSIKENVAY